MHKKFLAIVLSGVMLSASMTGCGKKAEPQNTETVATQETAETASTSVSSVDMTETEKASVTVRTGDSDGSQQVTSGIAEDGTYHKEGTDYTPSEIVASLPSKYALTGGVNGGRLEAGSDGKNAYFKTECADSKMEIYMIGDMLYLNVFENGTYTAKKAGSSSDTLATGTGVTTDESSIKSVEFKETKEYNNNTYNLVKVTSSDSDGMTSDSVFYINTSNGKCDYIQSSSLTGTSEGEGILLEVSEIQDIVEPDWASTCEDADEMTILGSMVSGLSALSNASTIYDGNENSSSDAAVYDAGDDSDDSDDYGEWYDSAAPTSDSGSSGNTGDSVVDQILGN